MTTERLDLSMALSDNERTRPIIDGECGIEGLRLLRPEAKDLELAHRLDRGTSGVLLLAKRRSALRTLHELLRESRVEKKYLALVKGRWPEAEAEYRRVLEKAPSDTETMAGLADVILWQGKLDEALGVLDTALDQVAPEAVGLIEWQRRHGRQLGIRPIVARQQRHRGHRDLEPVPGPPPGGARVGGARRRGAGGDHCAHRRYPVGTTSTPIG